MANEGRQVPVVLVPRFTTLVGSGPLQYTLPLDVSAYESAHITAWRGAFIGSGVLFAFHFLESTDRTSWSDVPGTVPSDPGAFNEEAYDFDLTKRWFRMGLALNGTNPGVTCWAQGFLIEREE